MEDDSDYSEEEDGRVCTISTASTLTAKSTTYRGTKGSFHRSQLIQKLQDRDVEIKLQIMSSIIVNAVV